MRKRKKSPNSSHLFILSPGNIQAEEDFFNNSTESTGMASEAASSMGEALDVSTVEVEPLQQSEIEPEGPSTPDEHGMSSMLIDAISNKWSQVSDYDSMTATALQLGYQEIADVLKTITSTEIEVVGKLLKALETVTPKVTLIQQGEVAAETTMNEALETADRPELDKLESVLGVTLSLTQENYIYDNWREFYNDPEGYALLSDLIKGAMSNLHIFEESIFNRKLEEGMMSILKTNDRIIRSIKNTDNFVDRSDDVADSETRMKEADKAFDTASKAFEKDGGFTGAPKAEKPQKPELPKSSLKESVDTGLRSKLERAVASILQDAVVAQEIEKLVPEYNMDWCADEVSENDEGIWQPVIKREVDLLLANHPDNFQEALKESDDKEFSTKYIHVIFTDEQSKDWEDADDMGFDLESQYNLTPTNIRHSKSTGVWEADLEGSNEDLLNYMNQNNMELTIFTKMNKDEWDSAYEVESNLRDLRFMVGAELSNDPEIDPYLYKKGKDGSSQKVWRFRVTYDEIPQSQRYTWEDPKAPFGEGGSSYEMSIDENGDYVIKVGSEEELKCAKAVAAAYEVPIEIKAEPWRRDPSERFKATIKIPSETDGIDIFKSK